MTVSANNGIYGLFALTEKSLGQRDRGVFADVLQNRWRDAQEPTALVQVEDRPGNCTPEILENENGISLFSGWLGDPPVDSDEGQANPSLSRVARTFDASGSDTPRLLAGEWSFLRWDKARCRLTIIASENLRDPLYYCRSGDTIAVAASLKLLSRLDWVSREFNAESLLLSLGRARLRRGFQHQSILENVWQLEPGSCIEIDASSHHHTRLPPAQPAKLTWTGSFDEAVEEVRFMLRRIMREHLRHYGHSAVMLSGGLDSTIMAWLLAEQGGDGQGHVALSSAAAPGSGLRDETGFAAKVAEQLGLPFHRVVPEESPSPYRPSAAMFAITDRPALSQRHYLYEALYGTAAGLGANVVLDGVYGEATLTAKLLLPWHAHPVRSARRFLRNTLRPGPKADAMDWFHVRLADHHTSALPERFGEIWNLPNLRFGAASGKRPLGYGPLSVKTGLAPTRTSLPQLRHALPFRDRRLMDLVAHMPASFLVNRDQNRVLGRAVLGGYITDDIRLRRSGMPFSPDYESRLVAHAAQARDRIDAFSTHGVDQWLDLPWLSQVLQRMAAGEAVSEIDKLKAQLTAMTAEFLLWWKDADQG